MHSRHEGETALQPALCSLAREHEQKQSVSRRTLHLVCVQRGRRASDDDHERPARAMAVTTNALASSPDTMPAFTLSEMVHDSSLCLVARVFATLQDLQLPDASTDAPAAGCSSSQPSPSASATGSQSMLSPPPSVVLASKRTQLVVAVCKPESASSHARDASPQPPNDACDDPLAPSNATQEPVQPLHASPLAIVVEVLLQKVRTAPLSLGVCR